MAQHIFHFVDKKRLQAAVTSIRSNSVQQRKTDLALSNELLSQFTLCLHHLLVRTKCGIYCDKICSSKKKHWSAKNCCGEVEKSAMLSCFACRAWLGSRSWCWLLVTVNMSCACGMCEHAAMKAGIFVETVRVVYPLRVLQVLHKCSKSSLRALWITYSGFYCTAQVIYVSGFAVASVENVGVSPLCSDLFRLSDS